MLAIQTLKYDSQKCEIVQTFCACHHSGKGGQGVKRAKQRKIKANNSTYMSTKKGAGDYPAPLLGIQPISPQKQKLSFQTSRQACAMSRGFPH